MRRLFSIAKKLQKPKHVEKSVSGVFYRPQQKVLHLKKKPPLVEFHFIKDVKIFFDRPRNRKNVLVIVSVLLSFSILTSFFRTYATVVTFYPKTCLGGWEHPEHATGKSTLDESASQSDFNHANSAFTKDQTTTLYCGEFQGEIPADTDPKHFELSFSWSIDNGSVVHYESQPFVVPANIEGGSVEQKIDATPVPIDAPIDGPIPELNTDASVLTAPVEAPTEGPTSFFQDFFAQKVFAQDAAPAVEVVDAGGAGEALVAPVSPVAPTADISPSESSTSSDQAVAPVPVVSTPEPETPTAFIDNASYPKGTTPPTAAELSGVGQTVSIDDAYNADKADGFMEVLYTLDGTNWKDLGTVSQNSWHGVKFEIPLSGWGDLSHFQVALKTLPTVDVSPAIYLDSMRLDIAYDEKVEKVTPPTIILKDGTDLIEGPKDFSSGEEPSFTIIDPGYSSFDVNNLVGNEKADVLEDPDNVVSKNEITKENIEQTKSTIDEIKNFFSSPTVDTPLPVAPTTDSAPTTDAEIGGSTSAPSATLPADDSLPSPPQTTIFDKSQPTSFLHIFKPLIAEAEGADVNPPLEATVVNNNGQDTDIPVIVDTTYVDGKQKNTLHIKKPERSFRPGHYTLKVKMYTKGATIITQQDFTWGVLAVNIDRTIYRPGDEALFQYGVLLDSGNTVCNADIVMTVEDPHGGKYNFTTDDGSIVRDTACGPNNVIDVPDYYAKLTIPNILGVYKMTVVSHSDSGTRVINDHFEVQSPVLFDVQRKSATRIFPRSTYPVILSITPTADWSGTVVDRVPASFGVMKKTGVQDFDSAVTVDDTTTVTWNVSLRAGVTTEIGYEYRAPLISPEFYLLGKAELIDGAGTTVFIETRNWQIASDAVCTLTNAAGSYTWDGVANVAQAGHGTATWTGCTGGVGFTPATGDTIQINSGLNLAVSGNASITALTMNTPTVANNFTVNNGVTVTVSGALTFNTNASAVTSSVTLGSGAGAGNLTVGSISMAAPTGGVASLEKINCSASGTGTLTVSGTGTIAITGSSTASNTGSASIDMSAGACNVTTGTGTNTLTAGTTGATPNAFITMGTGTLLFNKSLTFAGATAGKSKLTTANGTTISLNNATLPAVGSSGAYTITNATKLVSNGTSSVAYATAVSTWGTLDVNGGTLTLAAAAETFTGAVTITAGTLSLGNTFTASSTTSVTGSIVNTSSATTKTFTGLVTVNSGGSINLTTATVPAVVIGAGVTTASGAGTVNFGGGATTFSASPTFTGPVNITIGTTTIASGQTLTNNMSGTLTMSTASISAPTVANGMTLASGSTTATTTTLTFAANTTANAETITMNGTANLNVGSNLVMSNAPTSTGSNLISCGTTGSGTLTVTGTTAITGNSTSTGLQGIDMTAGGGGCNAVLTGLTTLTGGTNATGKAQLKLGTGNLTMSTGVTFAGTTLNQLLTTTSANTINFAGNWTNTTLPTLTINSGTTLKTTGTTTLCKTTGMTWPGKLWVASGTTSLALAETITGTTQVTGTLNNASGATAKVFVGAITVDAGGAFSLNVATLPTNEFRGGITVNGTGTFAATGTTTFTTNSQSIAGTSTNTLSFGATTISANIILTNSYGSGGTVTFSTLAITGGAITANSGLSLSTATTTTTTTTLTIGANASTGAFSDTISLNGSAVLTVGTTATFTIPTTTVAGAKEGIIAVSGASGTVSITGGTTTINGGATGTQFCGIDLSAGTNALSVAALTLTGGATGAASVLMGSGTFTSTGLVTLTGAAAAPSAVYTRTTGTMNIGAGWTFAGTVANTQLNTGASTINLTGTMSGLGTLSIASATFNTQGTAAINAAYTLPNLDVGQTTSGTTTSSIAGTVTITGNLDISASSTFTWNLAGTNLSVGGTTTIAGTISCPAGANLCNGSKTFTGAVTVLSGGQLDFSAAATSFPTTTFGGGIIIDNGAVKFNTCVSGSVSFTTNNQSIANGVAGSTIALNFGATTITTNTILVTQAYTGGTVTFQTLSLVSPTAAYGMDLSTGTVNVVTGLISFAANASAGAFDEDIILNGNATLSAGSLTMAAPTTTVTGAFEGIFAATSAAGSVTVTGATTITGGATGTQFCGIDLSASSTATTSLTLGATTINGGAAGVGGITMNTGNMTVNGAFSGGGTTANSRLVAGANTILFANGSSMALTLVTLSISSSTFNTSGSVTITGGYTLPNLNVLSGTTTLATGTAHTVSGATNIAGTLTNTTGTTAQIFSGLVTVQSGGSFTLNTASVPPVTFGGGIVIDQGAVAFTVGGAATFSATQAITDGAVTSGSWPTVSFLSTVAINTGVTLTNSYDQGTVALGTTVTVATGNTGLTLGTGSITTMSTSLTFTTNSTAGSAQQVLLQGTAVLGPAAISMPATTSTGTAKITASGSGATLTVSGTTTITGSSTASGGISSIDFAVFDTDFTTSALTITGGSTNAGSVLMGSGTFTSNGAISLSGNAAAAGDAILSSDTGLIDINAGITFSGTLAQAQLTTTGAVTINLTGTMSGVGILTWNASTSFVTVGTAAIASAYTLLNMTVTAGTTSVTGSNPSITNALTISNGGTLLFNVAAGGLFNANGTTGVSGSILCTATANNCSSTKKFVGLVTVNSGGIFDLSGATGTPAPVEFRGGIDMNGTTFNTGTGTASFTTNNQDLTGSGAGEITFNGPVSIASPRVVTNKWTSTLTNTASLIGTGTWQQFASTDSILNIDCTTYTITTFSATQAGNIVDYRANGQSPRATTYDTLRLSNGNGSPQADALSGATITVQTLFDLAANTELDMYGTSVLTLNAGSTLQGASSTTSVIQAQTGTSNLNIGSTTISNILLDNTTVGTSTMVTTYTNTAAGQNIYPATYYDLVINKTGQTGTLTGTTTVLHTLTHSAGTLDTASQTLSAQTMTMADNLTLGSTALTLSGTGTVFNRTAGTVTAGTSTITLSDTSNTAKTFAGGGQTFHDLVLAPGAATGASLYTISGSNTFNDFQDTGTAAHGILFTTGTTTTVTTFTVAGTVGNLVTINSTTTGTHALVKAGGGTISSDYLNIQHSVATPALTWYAGTHSTNNQGTATAGSGWIFTGVPSGISISGTGSSSNSGATVKVALNGTLQAQTAVVGGGGTWTISGVLASAGDVITVWVDAVAQANESTAITKYASGNVTGMDLSLNTLTVGSDQNQSMVVSDFNQYSCVNDEDVMQDVVSSVLKVSGDGSCAGGAQSYTDPIIVLLASNPLTVGTSETLLTGLIDINASGTLTATGSATIELNGLSGTLFTNSGTFNGGNSLVKFNGNSSPVLFAGSFTGGNSLYDLEVSPALTSGTKIYGSGVAVDAANNFTIDPSGAGGTAFHYNLGGIHTISGTILVQPTGGATAQIDTTGSNYDITANNINLQTASTMNCNNSTIMLTGTSGTLLTNSGTFNEDTSTVIVASASGTPTLLAGATTFHILTINTGATVVNAGSAITFDTTTSPTNPLLQIDSGAVFNDGGNQITGTTGSITVGANGVFCLGGTPAATNATCNNTATATTATTFPAFATVTLDPSSTVIYNANAATTISVQSYGNLSMLPVLSTPRAYNFASGTPTVAANFTISDTGSGLLTVTMNGNITVTNTTTIAGATATSSLVTTATPYNLTTGLLSVGTGGKLDCAGSSATITITQAPGAGTMFVLSGTFTPGTSNVVFSGNGASTFNAGSITFYDMTSSGTGTKAVASSTTLTINHTLAVTNGTFNPNGTTVTAAVGPNAISVSSGATLDVDGTTFAGSYSGFGIPTITFASGSTADYNRAGNQTIESALTYSNLNVSGGSGTKKPNNTLTVGASLTVLNGATLDTDSVGNYAVNTDRLVFQNGNVTANNSIITVSGTSGVPILYSAGTFTPNTSTVIYTGNNAGGDTTIETGISYYNLTVNNSSETYVLSNNLSLSSAGTLTVTNGTFDTVTSWSINTGHINIAGAVTAVLKLRNSTVNLNATTGPAALITKVGVAGTLTAGTSIVNFNGTASVTATSGNFINTNSFATLTSSNSGTFTFGGQVTATTLLQAGQGTIDTGNQQVKANSIVIGTAGTLVAGISTIEVTGTSLPVFTRTGSGVFTAGNSIVRMTGNANIGGMFSGAFTGGNSLNSLSFEPALTASPSYSLDMTNISVGGSLLFAPSAVSTNTMTVTMLSNITTGTAPGSLGISGATSGSTSLDMNGHTISTGDLTISSTDTLIAGPTTTVAGSWTNGGTFTHSNGTVTFNSGTTATVAGSTTFYDLSITHTSAKEVDFTASGGTPTFTVANAFTVTGHVGQLIKLYSTASPTQWDFLPTGTAAVDYADVMDGGCHSGAITITPTNSIDSGNNGTCWSFGAAVTFDIDVSPTGVASTAPYSVPLGILSTASVTKSDNASINMIVLSGTTSSSGGMSITVQNSNGGNGLASLSVPSDKIPSATATMSAGTANYGLCVDSATLTGFTRDPAYVTTCAISSGTNAVVGLTAAPAAIVGSSGAVANGQAKIVVNAAISPVTPAHNDYQDTLTFIATANF